MSDDSLFDFDDQRRLNLTQTTREMIIRQLTPGGKLSGETSDRVTLMQALDGMDRTTIAVAKIKVEDTASRANEEIAARMADFLVNSQGRNAQFTRSTAVEAPDLPEIKLVEGEDSLGVHPVTYEDMMREDT